MSFALVTRRSASALRRGPSMPNISALVRLESSAAASSAASGATAQASQAAKSAAGAGKDAAVKAKEAASKAGAVASEYSTKASAMASEYSSKAAQGLSRVTATAGPAITGYAKGALGALSRVGGPAAKLVGFIERQTPFVVYYSKVGLELGKLVFHGQKMSPPSVATFQAYWQNALNRLKNPTILLQGLDSPAGMVQKVRGISRAQWAAGGVLAAELIGFFTVGEIIGRFKLIGYRGATNAHH